MTIPKWLKPLPLNKTPARPALGAAEAQRSFDTYEARAPSAQNCIDAVPGWNSALPEQCNVVAGKYAGYSDDRIRWMIERFGPIADAKILELGPLEAAHTYMLHQQGATITAVEANKQAFLRCLVTKELLDLGRAKFLLGDCVQHLEQDDTRYDLIVACGVLYHMRDPLRFLSAVAARTDALYLWSNFIDVDVLEPDSDLANGFAALRETRDFHGVDVKVYRLNYNNANKNLDFCGGIYDTPRWMDRASILDCLRVLGFSSLEVAHEQRPLPHEPSFSVYAKRPQPSVGEA